MSRYLYNAAYYWEVVVDGRNPESGFTVYLEERSTGKRRPLRTIPTRREMDQYCLDVQKDLYLSEEEFEAKYGVQLSTPAEPETPADPDATASNDVTQAA